MMRRFALWSLLGVLLVAVLFIFLRAVHQEGWSGLGVGGLCAGVFSNRRAAAQAEAAPREKRAVPPIDAVLPAATQTATFALG